MNPLTCGWDSAQYLIFSDNVFAPLIYYSHLGPLILSLLLGTFVFFNNPRATVNRVFLGITVFFSVWVFFDLVLWASERPEYIMFFWSVIVPIEILIYILGWYLIALFANDGRNITLRQQVLVVLSAAPIFLFTASSYNLLGFDLTNCDREAIEGPLVQYLYALELVYIIWASVIAWRGYLTLEERNKKLQLLTVSIGVLCFLFFFSVGNILVSFFLNVDWSYEQYKLFGMPIFASIIAYSAIRFRTFDLRVFTAQALVAAVAILTISLLFLRSIENVRIVTVITFILICALGFYLIRSVRQEIEQRELIEEQEKKLEQINRQQEGLLAFISHEVKGYLAKSQAAFAGIAQGDYGAISPQLNTMAETGLADMRKGVDMVADILDASNLRKGTVAYDKHPFDLKHSADEVIHDLQAIAEKKGLRLTFSASAGDYRLIGDEAKMRRHVIRNLIDNSIHYTQQGSITVSLSRNDSTIHFSVKDTGVGITKEDMQNLFTEGGHGKESMKINSDSTGYGLFIAKQVTEAHGGKIWAQSKGKGDGSEFIAEFPTGA